MSAAASSLGLYARTRSYMPSFDRLGSNRLTCGMRRQVKSVFQYGARLSRQRRIDAGGGAGGAENPIRRLHEEPHHGRQPAWMLDSLILESADTVKSTVKNNSAPSIPATLRWPGIPSTFAATRPRNQNIAISSDSLTM